MDCGILDEYGNIRKSVHEAKERGIIFDVGHGRGAFSWDVAERALQQNFQPQTISSDVSVYNYNGPVYDLATTANKFLQLGLSMDEVIEKVTLMPAKALRMADQIGTLRMGAWGDAVIFELQTGHFEFLDSRGKIRVSRHRLLPKTVVKAGKIYKSKNLIKK
jgi:dihydroorotase